MSNETEREAFIEWGKSLGLTLSQMTVVEHSAFKAGAKWQRSQSAPDTEALKAEILSLTVRLENSDAVISSIQKIITRLNKGEPDEQ